MTRWVSYFIDSYLAQMSGLKEVTNRILQLNIRVDRLRKEGLITETHNKVLSFLYSREKASYEELRAHLGGTTRSPSRRSTRPVTKSRVHQVLKPLRAAHILVEEKIGSRIWFKLGSPEDDIDETVFRRPVKKKVNSKTVDNSKALDGSVPVQKVLPIFE